MGTKENDGCISLPCIDERSEDVFRLIMTHGGNDEIKCWISMDEVCEFLSEKVEH